MAPPTKGRYYFRDLPYLHEIAKRGDEKAINELIKAAKGNNTSVRLNVIIELGKLRAIKAAPLLCRMLLPNSRTENCCKEEAAKALGEIAKNGKLDGSAIDRLLDACANSKLAAVRSGAATSLGHCIHCRTFGKRRRKRAIAVLFSHLACSFLNVRRTAGFALDALGWKADNIDDEVLHLIAKEDWETISRTKKRMVESLTKALQRKKELNITKKAIARTLGGIGNLSAASVVLSWLFANGTLLESDEELEAWIDATKPLFGQFSPLITKASCYVRKTKTEWEDSCSDKGEIKYHYDCKTSKEALIEICQIKGQISTNILHHAAYKEDVNIVTGIGWNEWGGGENHGVLSFKEQREIAQKELEKRRSKKAAKTAYLRRKYWLLPK